MAVVAGDFESVGSHAVGESGGGIPSVTELLLDGWYDGFDIAATSNIGISYAVLIQTDDSLTPDASIGLVAGAGVERYFTWITGRPDYDGVTVIPTGENKEDTVGADPLNVWTEGILCLPKQIASTVRMINIIITGDYGSLSGFNFAIDNTSLFSDTLEADAIFLINRKIKFFVVLDDVFTQVWQGIVSELKFNETTFQFICEDDFKKVHKRMPANQITLSEFPKALDDSLSKPIPISFGNVNKARLFNVTGNPDLFPLGFSSPVSLQVQQGFLFSFRGAEVLATGASVYTTASGESPKLTLLTPFANFPKDFFATNNQYFIHVIIGDEQTIRITANDATVLPNTTDATTIVSLSAPLSGTDAATFVSSGNAYINNLPTTDTFYFQMIKFDVNYILSENPIQEFIKNNNNELELTHFDKNLSKYDNLNELIENFDKSPTVKFKRPFVRLLAGRLDQSRNITIFSRIPFDAVSANVLLSSTKIYTQSELLKIIDRDRTTKVTSPSSFTDEVTASVVIRLPLDKLKQAYKNIYIVPDFDITVVSPNNFILNTFLNGFDNLGRIRTAFNSSIIDVNEGINNIIPNEFYIAGGNDNNETSKFHEVVSGANFKDAFKLSADFITAINNGIIVDNISMQYLLSFVAGTTTFDYKEIAVIGERNIELFSDDWYVKLKGEIISGAETNNVNRAFQHILETFDGIASADIEFNDLSSTKTLESTRSHWELGRQITDRKLSSEYLKQLAQQSFVGIYPTRKGQRGLKAFFENKQDPDNPTQLLDGTLIKTFNDVNGTILENSITKFEKSSIANLFNDFKINYDFDPGREKFNKSITITNTDLAAFPGEFDSLGTDDTQAFDEVDLQVQETAVTSLQIRFKTPVADPLWNNGEFITLEGDTDGFEGQIYFKEILSKEIEGGGDVIYAIDTTGLKFTSSILGTTGTLHHHTLGIPKWTTFVGGIEDFKTAKEFWTVCSISFKRSERINKLPDSLANCFWFPDPEHFAPGAGQGESSARKFLENLLEWTTRQKDITEFAIPINSANLTLELLTPINFLDTKFTNGKTRFGYITKIKVEPSRDRMVLEAVLEPDDIVFFPPGACTIIRETGSTTDKITESGSQLDTISEGGCT